MINRKNGFINLRSVSAKIVTVLLSLVFMGCSVLGNSDSDDDTLTLAAAFALLANQDFDCTDDGLIWTENPTPQNGGWQSITYGNGLFVTVGNTGTDRVATSSDGQTWTMRSDAGADASWYSVTYSNGRFVAANADGDSQQIMTSTDGITWSRVSESSNGSFVRSAADDSGRFVVVPIGTTNPANELLVSSGGLSWSTVTTPFANNESHGNVNYGNGMFLIFNQTTKTESITSTDGTTWSSVHTVPSGVWSDAVYGNGRWVAVG
ncbi:MAG: hypothetical protein KDK33_20725, partial [Leptospiraceae bacterium]|nr:hypothetical protein [Leptospiraceae bacterium]